MWIVRHVKQNHMQVVTNSQLLAQELRLINKVIPNKPVLAILSNVLIDCQESMRFFVTDLEIGLQTECIAAVYKPGKVTLPAQKLLSIVEKFPNAEVTLIEEKSHVKITCAGYTSNLQTQHIESFPTIPVLPGLGSRLETKSLQAMVQRVKYALTDSNKMVMNGALLRLYGEYAGLVATDAKRLSVATMARVPGIDDTAILPAKLLNMLAILKEENTSFSQTTQHLFFISGTRMLVSRKLDGSFVNYERIIPTGNQLNVEIDRKNFIAALKRVGALSDDQTIHLFLGNKVNITTASSFGDANESIDAISNITMNGLPVCVNYTFLIDFLEAAAGDTIILTGKDASSPLMLLDGDEFINVVMVMRKH